MSELLTATDLDDWSRRRDAQAHLPTLVRSLVMATVAPSSLRMPAAEGVSAHGLDGVIEVVGGSPPYVPAGRSAWEMGAGAGPAKKAEDDYTKRTTQLSEQERAVTTFVFVTSRSWSGAAAWAKSKAKGKADGWAGVRAFDAQDLATWLATCPGVHARMSEHTGRLPYGVTPLRRWFEQWAEKTEPAVPAALLLCGRREPAGELAALLAGPATEQHIASGSEEESVAFVAAVLLGAKVPVDDDAAGTDADDESDQQPTQLEALLERAVVVHDASAWRRCLTYERPTVLLPLFDEPDIGAAVRAGHHVVLARAARQPHEALPPLHRAQARAVWEQAGLGFGQADDLARASRRSLTSLRRRIGRTGRFRQPPWAEGATASLLATVLLAGSWRDDVPGDRDVVCRLAERAGWRGLARDLTPLAHGSDAPLIERNGRWEFVDVIDAWERLKAALSAEDLGLLNEEVLRVLTEPDPVAALPVADRTRLALSADGLPRRAYSAALRGGLAGTLRLLGAIEGDRVLPGGRTGQQHADSAVYELLHDADVSRWQAVADLLPEFAEAAPSVLLDSVERSLKAAARPIMRLFEETDDPFGLTPSSRHTPLLWALETLAFSPRHVARVATLLGRLTELDPGGRLANRPAESLQSILHLARPQSAIDATTRLAVIDAVRHDAPSAGWSTMLALVTGLHRGMVLRRGPRMRDWVVPTRPTTTRADLKQALAGIGERIAADVGDDPERWGQALEVIDKIPPAARTAMLATADHVWPSFAAEVRQQLIKKTAERAARHLRHRDARWALDEESIAELQAFLDRHGESQSAVADAELFSWLPERRRDELNDPAALATAREQAVRRALTGDLAGVLALAEQATVPGYVGEALARLTDTYDGEVLDLLTQDGAAHQLSSALAAVRRRADPGWLAKALAERPDLAVSLLLCGDLDAEVLEVLPTMPAAVADAFWSRAQPWRVRDIDAIDVAEHFLAHDRPYAAAWLVSDLREGVPFPVDLAYRALAAPIHGTSDDLTDVPSPEYMLGELLSKLEANDLPEADLATLEWYYLPALEDYRAPRALFARLARDPGFFAELVCLVYRADDQEDETVAESADTVETDTDDRAATDDDTDDDTAHDETATSAAAATAAWRLLHDWHTPLPGCTEGVQPSATDVQAWVTTARVLLQERRRGQVAGSVLGQALSGPVTDPDGTWPCAAVRAVLEHELDDRLENGLQIGRLNQRGVTSRGVYDGGAQEWTLVEQYRDWAERVRHASPRTGVVLDGIAESYAADARREDVSAARNSER